ncbi:MAG: DUF72 domain-containing protein [Candidatus Eisenbacteria bacterium]|nr:DUF72 domain-containing protein [Candidatus Eisenbacteria bacterium]
MSARVLLGTQGWSYSDWIGVFYPPGAKPEHYLPFYSQVFDTVELDTTFYDAPKVAIARSWGKRVPGSFRFAAKVPRAITHDRRLAATAAEFESFVRSLDPLGEKLGPLLIQLPAEFTRDESTAGTLRKFLAQVPAGVKVAVEFRDASWHDEATYEVLRQHNAAFAWTQWRDLPRVTEVTADFLYLRWLGVRDRVEKYDRVSIDRSAAHAEWEADLTRALPRVREVYGYFNNHWAGHSPASANEMKRRLGLIVVEPRDRWSQRELW